jgi:hypothetical protein
MQKAGFEGLNGWCRLLRRDFERLGVHLEEQQRQQVAYLTAHIHSLGMRFGGYFPLSLSAALRYSPGGLAVCSLGVEADYEWPCTATRPSTPVRFS